MRLPNLKNLDKFTFFLIGISLVIIIIVVYLISIIFKIKFSLPKVSLPQRQAVTQNALNLTSPISVITGKVERVNRDTVWVSQVIKNSEEIAFAPPLPNDTVPPTPTPKIITYRVHVPQSALVTKMITRIPYLFRTDPSPASINIAVSDLKPGQTITVNSATDLRLTNPDNIEAASITFNASVNTISGTITQNTGSQISLKTAGGDYFITINPDTEISEPTLPTEPNQPYGKKQLSASELALGTEINAYTAEDFTNQHQFTATLIQPVTNLPLLAPPPALP